MICSGGPGNVYEVVEGPPIWSSLVRLSGAKLAQMVTRTVTRAIKSSGRVECAPVLASLRSYIQEEMPASLCFLVLETCLRRDRLSCHHNPTDCLTIELWEVFHSPKFRDVAIEHHEFAFSKTTNYPDIVHNLDRLLLLMATPDSLTTTQSFKMECKQCEVGWVLQDRLCKSMAHFPNLRRIEVPRLASDQLLAVIASNCHNLNHLNISGCRDLVTDAGFHRFVETATWRSGLRFLDISRVSLSQQVFLCLQRLSNLGDLTLSTTALDDIQCSAEGEPLLVLDNEDTLALTAIALPSVTRINVDNDNYVQVSINKVMMYLRAVFPGVQDIQLANCIACELHVTLTQHPSHITYMREHIHTLELISADYFTFPRLVYPCPSLESLGIEKPTNDLFNLDHQNVPLMYDNSMGFLNLKHLKLSRISLTNLSHFLSKSSNLREFRVSGIGRRERPRWTDQRIREILHPHYLPRLAVFHVSCSPNEGFSTSEHHRYLHLTVQTVRYLCESFPFLNRIAGIESWDPRQCSREAVDSLLRDASPRFTSLSI